MLKLQMKPVTRRQFLGGAAALGAACATRVAFAQAGHDAHGRAPAGEISAIEPAGAPRRIKLAQDARGTWTINGWTYDAGAVPLTVKRGAAETWLVENDRKSMPHPMHIHGFQFRGVLDTVHVWPGEAVLVALDFSHSHSGDQDYVFHCHNLEHGDLGMMIRYRVTA
jgi:suppressor of ftsI/bilirubin oxidase